MTSSLQSGLTCSRLPMRRSRRRVVVRLGAGAALAAGATAKDLRAAEGSIQSAVTRPPRAALHMA